MTASKNQKPNILLFFTDQQRADTMGLAGNPLDLTPNLDRIGTAGAYFPLAFTPQPVCGPARSCLQSGMFATKTGCYRNAIPYPDGMPTLGERMQAAGYHTAYIGKWHLAPREITGAVPSEYRRGYDYWLASNVLEFTSDAYDTRMYDNEGSEVRLPGYRVDAVADAAIRHFSEEHDKPWFLTVSFIEPHHQNSRDDYPAPVGYEEKYAGRWTPPDLQALPAWDGSGVAGGTAARHLPGYCGMIKRLDEALGRMEDALRSTGQLENTVLLFFSDHGCHFKTRNGEYKRSVHDASVRIPFVCSGPGFQAGGRRENLVSLLDIPPTVLDFAGAEVPESFDGRSLLPILRGEAESWPDDVYFQISESEVGRGVRTKRWKYGVTAKHKDRLEADSDRYEETHLYDLKADPWELNNLIRNESHRVVADRMRQRLLDWMEKAGEKSPEILPPPELFGLAKSFLLPEEINS